MTHKVTIQPSGNSFIANEDETILAAAMRSGFTLPYGCRNGACAACKGKIIKGTVDHGNPQSSALAEFEKRDGLSLFCQAVPQSDLTIEAREIESSGDIEVRRLPSRVEKIERVAEDVVILKLKLPANERFQFLRGSISTYYSEKESDEATRWVILLIKTNILNYMFEVWQMGHLQNKCLKR